MIAQRLNVSGFDSERHLRQICESVPAELSIRQRVDLLDEIYPPERTLDTAAGYLGLAPEQAEDGNNEMVVKFRRHDGLAVFLAVRDDVRDRVIGMCVPPGHMPSDMPDLWYPLPLGNVESAVEYVCDWLVLAEPESPWWTATPEASLLRERVVGSVPLSCYYVRCYDDAPDQVMVWFNNGRANYVVAFIFIGADGPDSPLLMHCHQGSMGPIMTSQGLEHAADYIKHCLSMTAEDNSAYLHH